jgi:predicted nuclease of predicted toxin-antitoxin system
VNLVADEGIEAAIVRELRAGGYSVTYFAEEAPASSDRVVLDLAHAAQSLLLTADKDFGELIFRQGLTSAGVVLVRLHGLSTATKAHIVLSAIKSHAPEMLGAFTVLSPGAIRIRHRESAGA